MSIGEFIDFKSYKEHHGEMTRAQFDAVCGTGYTEKDYAKAFDEIVALGYGFPDAAQADVLARISNLFPARSAMWKLSESYLILGRF